jgi:hypothetical protein
MAFLIKKLSCFPAFKKKETGSDSGSAVFIIYRYLSIFGNSHVFLNKTAETNILNHGSITHNVCLSIAVDCLALGFGVPERIKANLSG